MRMGLRTEMSMAVMCMVFLMKNWCQKELVSAILKQKGYDTLQIEGKDWNSYKEEQYDQLADILRESLDMKAIYKMME